MSLNDAEEYVCVRVQIVKVKKSLFGHTDTVLGFTTLIPDTVKRAELMFKRIQRMFNKEGLNINV